MPKPIGKISEFNAQGKEVIRKDLPMEKVYKAVYRTWEDWHGSSHSGIVYQPYKRYPRLLLDPPSQEFLIAHDFLGNRIVSSQLLIKNKSNEESILPDGVTKQLKARSCWDLAQSVIKKNRSFFSRVEGSEAAKTANSSTRFISSSKRGSLALLQP